MPPTAGSASSGSASKKRKLGEDTTKVVKYYAVRTGKVPGVYTSWEDCKDNTYGFKGASFAKATMQTVKSFSTRGDALDFVAGKNPSNPADPEKYYGLAVGDKPGVYTDWAECQRNMVDTKGPKFRKFSTREDAEEFVKDWRKFVKKEKEGDNGAADGVEDVVVEDGPRVKKVKVGDGRKKDGTGDRKTQKVYTDGSSLGNGKAESVAGVGVWFGHGDPRNVSIPLQGPQQTNQRAELTAIQRALEIVPKSTDMEIITDSQYSINCATKWYRAWVKKGWVTNDGKNVVNRDLVEGIRALIEEREKNGAKTEFTWVKGHSGGEGNEAADRLAVAGAQMGRR